MRIEEECCADGLRRCAVQVSPVGTFLVVDGVVRGVIDVQQGYAGPQVHLITTEEPWDD